MASRQRRRDRARSRYEDFSTEGLIRHRASAAVRSAAQALARLEPLVRRRVVPPVNLVQVASLADALTAAVLAAVGAAGPEQEDA